jgi:hypothetical protein
MNLLIDDGCSGLSVCFYGLAIIKLIHANGDDREEKGLAFVQRNCVIEGCRASHRHIRGHTQLGTTLPILLSSRRRKFLNLWFSIFLMYAKGYVR